MSKQTIDHATKNTVATLQDLVSEMASSLRPFGCTSATFYVRDHLLPYYLRRIADSGVLLRELMHGPLSTRSVVGSIMFEPSELTDNDWFCKEKIQEISGSRHANQESNPREQPLYCTFAARESVASATLIRFVRDGVVIGCCWANFGIETNELPKAGQNAISKFQRNVGKILDELHRQLFLETPLRIRRFEDLHSAAKHFPASRSGTSLEIYLNKVLSAAISVLNLNSDGFAAVYLLDEGRILRRVAQQGPVAEDAKSTFYVDDLEGFVSIAAKTGSPVFVEHPLERFPSKYISVQTNAPPTLQQIVIPLLVRTEVVGVINIESKQTLSTFDESYVFDLFAAGLRIASSIRVAQETARSYDTRTMQLLELASQAVCESEPDGHRENLQRWAKDAFGADHCSLWEWNNTTKRFHPSDCRESPRECGFSSFIIETGAVLWVRNVDDPEVVDLLFWDENGSKWSAPPAGLERVPSGVNNHVKEDQITHQLGLPIVFKQRRIGVVWFKFKNTDRRPPSHPRMQLATGVVAELASILQLKEKHAEHDSDLSVEQHLKKTFLSLCPPGAFNFPGGDGFVIAKPKGSIGGDFFAKTDLKKATGFIVGDGEGHGLRGATAMLPLATAFEMCSQRFRSPRQMLWDMNESLSRMESVRGSAICFVVDSSRDHQRLIVSSAAHPKLLLCRPGKFVSLPEGNTEGFQFGVGQQMYYDNLLDETTHDLSAGDVLVAVTDGVTEAGVKGRGGAMGVDRLISIVSNRLVDSPELIALAIERAMLQHCDGDVFDDYTILVIKVNECKA